MRRVTVALGLELYALSLAALQLRGGVRTDEAKYLLDIPYPHPPVGRFLFHLFEGWTAQELFLRIVLATLLVQGVWLVCSMGRSLAHRERLTVCGTWLLAAPVILQAGTIMLAPLTALQGLVLVWLFLRRDIDITRSAGWLTVFWGLSLFSAFQAILYLPIVLSLLRRARLPRWLRAFCVTAPLVLVTLYVLGQPHAAASFLLVQGDNAGLSLLERLRGVVVLLGLAGSVFGTLLGLAGILSRKQSALLWTSLLLSAYVLLSFHEYYAILFLPLLCAGMVLLLRRFPLPPLLILAPMLLGTLLIVRQFPWQPAPGLARAVMRAVAAETSSGTVLIAGAFGHEWQYESRLPIRRYRPEFLRGASAVVCLAPCPEVRVQDDWVALPAVPVEAWIRR